EVREDYRNRLSVVLAQEVVQMVDRLVDLPQDLRQARGDAGQPRTARADDRITRSRFGGEDRRVLGTAGDLDIGDTAQEVGFEVGRRVLLDDDVVLDLDGDADLLDVAGVDPDLLDPAGGHAVVLDDRALAQTADRASEINVVDGILRRQLSPADPQYAAKAERDQDHHEAAAAIGSSPAVGSSRNRISGSSASERARPERLRMPPDNCDGNLSPASSGSPTIAILVAAICAIKDSGIGQCSRSGTSMFCATV